MCVASSRKPHPPGGPRAAFHAGHIAAPHHRGAADHLLSEVNRAAPGRRLPSVCLLRLDPRLIFLSRLKPLSEHEIERVRSGHRSGGGLETGGVQRLMGKQLHLQRARAKNSRVRSGHSQSFAGRRDGSMRRSSFASLRWLILVLVFAVCLLYVLNCLCSVDQISALCLLFAFSTPPPPLHHHLLTPPPAAGRFKNHRKALVTSVDKKIPNGFMEEQGSVVERSVEGP